MWTRSHICDACRAARATVETDTGFFLCSACEATVVITFQEFELPEGLSAGDATQVTFSVV